MKSPRVSLAMVAGVMVCLGAAAEIRIWIGGRKQAVQLQGQLKQREQEYSWLVSQTPAPSEGTTTALAADITLAERRLAELQSTLRSPLLQREPFSPLPREAYFAIAATVARLRADAERHGVRIGREENFGLASHVQSGPPPELIEVVHRQQQLIAILLGCLWEARPEEFAGLRRERPLPVAQRGERRDSPLGAASTPAAGESSDDFFSPDGELRVDVPGLVESQHFRCEFIGRTKALRDFLNSLAAHRHPFLVRSVEVTPHESTSPGSEEKEPLVRHHASRFAVVVAAIELPDNRTTP